MGGKIGQTSLGEQPAGWARVDLNHRPHAYQASIRRY